MSFNKLIERVSEPALRKIVTHWNEARGLRSMPGWSEIRPAAMAPFLSNVWAWKFDRATGRFTGRLAGEVLVQALNGSPRGMDAEEFFSSRGGSYMVDIFRRVVEGPSIAFQTGAVFMFAGKHGLGQRAIMPLSEDGALPDGVLGGSVYRFPSNYERNVPWRFHSTMPPVEYIEVRRVLADA